jgi:hypothetical protein
MDSQRISFHWIVIKSYKYVNIITVTFLHFSSEPAHSFCTLNLSEINPNFRTYVATFVNHSAQNLTWPNFNDLLTNSTEQGPLQEANSSPASRETLHFLGNPKDHHLVHKSSALAMDY